MASAERADLAAAAAAVLTSPGHEQRAYELTGATAWTLADLAAVAAEVLGREVVYTDLPAADHAAALRVGRRARGGRETCSPGSTAGSRRAPWTGRRTTSRT